MTDNQIINYTMFGYYSLVYILEFYLSRYFVKKIVLFYPIMCENKDVRGLDNRSR